MKKLRSSSGETLIEVLASILVVALSVTLLYTLILSASSINRRAKELGSRYETEYAAAENRTGQTSGTVSIGGAQVPVYYYSSGDGALTAYAPVPEGSGG